MVMRWSYKTILYELKKEGILGSAFLDESEIEQSLNEFGASGWEHVSMLETRDGIIAVFKQPLGRVSNQPVSYQTEEELEAAVELKSAEMPLFDEDLVNEAKPVIRQRMEPDDEDQNISGIGAIRIE